MKGIMELLRTEFSSRLQIQNIAWTEEVVFPEITAGKLAILGVSRSLIDNALKYG
jgi:hypothetical protein